MVHDLIAASVKKDRHRGTLFVFWMTYPLTVNGAAATTISKASGPTPIDAVAHTAAASSVIAQTDCPHVR
jgi:hypothetical protein